MSDALTTGTNTTDTGSSEATAANTAVDAANVESTAASTAQTGATETAKATDSTTEAVKPATAPEKYEFKAPEGKSFSPEIITAYEGVARELNLPQEGAQKILDTIAPKLAEVQQQAIAKVHGEWEQAAKTDKEFGGEKLTENLAVAQKALTAFGTPELKTFLNETGLGNHPELIRAFVRAGKAISEDRFVPAGTSTDPKSGGDLASRLYPSQKS